MRKVLTFITLMVATAVTAFSQDFTSTVFSKGDNGFDTYRIPAIVQAADGTLLAFAEARKNSRSDAGDIDLVVRRSEDGGRTWGEIITVWDEGENTCGNPAPIVDRETGRILLPMTWNLGTDKEKAIHRRESVDTRRVFLTWSDDNGLTWSPAEEITASVKLPEWTWYATGPCHALQLSRGKHRGRVVIPCNHGVFGSGTVSFVFYSDNGGANWQIGGSPDVGNEATVAERKDGSIMLNMRKGKYRLVAVSSDGGETFSDAWTDSTLVEPGCQGSIINYAPKGKSGRTLFFSNPASQEKREKMTIRRSDDGGYTWRTAFTLDNAHAAYSDLVVLSDGGLGLLFETGESMTYERIDYVYWSKQAVKESR